MAAMFVRAAPLMVLKRPPMYTTDWSGEAVTARTVALAVPRVTSRTQLVGAPEAASSTARLAWGWLCGSPAAVPGGRSWAKEPPTTTLPWAEAMPQTVPSVCQVGSASAVNGFSVARALAGVGARKPKSMAPLAAAAASVRGRDRTIRLKPISSVSCGSGP